MTVCFLFSILTLFSALGISVNTSLKYFDSQYLKNELKSNGSGQVICFEKVT